MVKKALEREGKGRGLYRYPIIHKIIILITIIVVVTIVIRDARKILYVQRKYEPTS
jgi:hypothetical protein